MKRNKEADDSTSNIFLDLDFLHYCL